MAEDQAFAEKQPWYRDAKTLLQAQDAGQPVAGWPAPCPDCGALYRRTPAGRWVIDHFPHRRNGHDSGVVPLQRPRRTEDY